MTTLFEKLTEYQNKNSAPPLTHVQKSNLGRNISTYWQTFNGSDKLPLIKSIEDTGTFLVIAYPDSFSDKLTELIDTFYNSVRKRKRTPIKKSVWSAKPNSNTE
jgi:hypothetical protein